MGRHRLKELSFVWVLGKSCVILLLHSLGLPCNYFDILGSIANVTIVRPGVTVFFFNKVNRDCGLLHCIGVGMYIHLSALVRISLSE